VSCNRRVSLAVESIPAFNHHPIPRLGRKDRIDIGLPATMHDLGSNVVQLATSFGALFIHSITFLHSSGGSVKTHSDVTRMRLQT
jgi:hypothetical protein